ncbi:PAN domain protein [Ancylostoma ceylanicum]|uniref:PAN domain protein n=1 Tax=Ancylostoma ceylanicum TaxID=53326 RepID=A0A0D6MAD7_9BILA|nr:PAN domain protein [Ancylostoma ceylanicum]
MQLVTASLLSLLALTHLARAADKPLIIENGAVCENKATGFFVVDNTILGTTDSIVYKDTPEEDCLNTCSTNRDRYGRSILCASFVYDHVSFTCTIFKEKAKPEGKADAVQAVGKRYFEKVCLGGIYFLSGLGLSFLFFCSASTAAKMTLDIIQKRGFLLHHPPPLIIQKNSMLTEFQVHLHTDAVPVECADSQFIRADDSVLIGFARNVTLVETMEQCVEQCVKEQDCKSAMYFYEEGECITNTESALSKPSSFAKEENEKVVYFQNGCLTKLQSQETTTTSTEPSTTTESAEESDAAPEKEHADLTTVQPSEDVNSEKEAEAEAKSKEETGNGEEVTETANEPTTTSVESTTSSEISSVPPTSVIREKTSDEEEADDTTSAENTSTTTTTGSVAAAESEPEEKLDEEDEDYGGEDENGEVQKTSQELRLKDSQDLQQACGGEGRGEHNALRLLS